MVDRSKLVDIYYDTKNQIRTDEILVNNTLDMMSKTRLYLDHFKAIQRDMKSQDMNIELMNDTPYRVAIETKQKFNKVTVLSFANATMPGGAVQNGAMGLEERLCRSSNLYEGLNVPYINRHFYKYNQKETDHMYSDRIVYLPNVTVFKSDDTYPQPLESYYKVNVISSAPPRIDFQTAVSDEELGKALLSRIKNILEVAIDQKTDVLILGAFGCDTYHLPTDLVALVFHHWLVRKGYYKYFKKVIFTIDNEKYIKVFYKTFKEVL